MIRFSWGLCILILLTCCTARTNLYAQESFLFGLTVHGRPVTAKKLFTLEAEVGVPVRIVNFYLQWPKNPKNRFFPGKSLEVIHDFGALACLTWEPMFYFQEEEKMIKAEQVLNGTYDHYIQAFAKQASKLNYKFILRFAHEMNIQRYHWGTSKQDYGKNSPNLYKKMFRYIVTQFRQQGAENVIFAFCPNAESVPNTSYDPSAAWNKIKNYYPGDEYVHILGLDGYNWGNTQTEENDGWNSQWLSFEQIFSRALHELQELSAQKPVLIFECASVAQGGNREKWLLDALEKMHFWRIKGLCWFQVDKEVNWKFKGSKLPGARSRLRQMTFKFPEWLSISN